jgi:hypothetical protein
MAMDVGELTVKVIPEIDGAAFRDAAVLIAGVRLADSLYYQPASVIEALPPQVHMALADMQKALRRLRDA